MLDPWRLVGSPLGPLGLLATEKGLCRLDFDPPERLSQTDLQRFGAASAGTDGPSEILDRAERWLGLYFDRQQPDPGDVPLDLQGTDFERRVWSALLEIPAGRTDTYGALARRLALPNGARAVGAAAGRNPVGILVPCHRLIGANGQLTGYAGGLERKRWLLHHEGALLFAL